jgi:hypothetical protein
MKQQIKKQLIVMCAGLLILFSCVACSGVQANENQA